MSARPVSTPTPGPELKFGWFLLALAFWCVASVAGTLGRSLPREALLSTKDGRGLGPCESYNWDAVSSGQAKPYDWCTVDAVIGRTLPPDVISSPGHIMMKGIGPGAWADALLRPDLWFTIGIGGVAIVLIYVFARNTGTLRAGLAAAITIVFLGLLLFPSIFTARIPVDMRSELVTAWQWVVIFYFGSEAAVQAWKVSNPTRASVPGDVPTAQPKARKADE